MENVTKQKELKINWFDWVPVWVDGSIEMCAEDLVFKNGWFININRMPAYESEYDRKVWRSKGWVGGAEIDLGSII